MYTVFNGFFLAFWCIVCRVWNGDRMHGRLKLSHAYAWKANATKSGHKQMNVQRMNKKQKKINQQQQKVVCLCVCSTE